jgi:hypothetical protein
MTFTEARDMLMEELDWDQRVATLAIRLATGADTWEGIAQTPNFSGQPLLTTGEERKIRTIGLGTIREEMTQ